MGKIIRVCNCICAVLILTLNPGCGREPEPPAFVAKPNILLIIADDLGWGDLAPYGNPKSETVELGRLADRGTLFRQFYVASPVCTPSRAGFLTGRFPAEIGFHHVLVRPDWNRRHGLPDFLDPSLPLLTRSLHAAGYRVGHFGKWHLGGEEGPEMAEYGIDSYRIAGRTHSFKDEGKRIYWTESSDRIVDATLEFIRDSGAEPFFANVWFLTPHVPLYPSQEDLERFEHLGPSAGPYLGATQIYYASVFAMDRAVGRLLDALDEAGMSEDTLVIFTSDNGPEEHHLSTASYAGVGSTGPFRGRKRSLYEGGIRMPLIVSWPGTVPSGQVDDRSIVAAVDLFPTLVELTGGEVRDEWGIDGENVTEALLGRPRDRNEPLFWEWRFHPAHEYLHISPSLAIREGDWKLLMNPGRQRMELYNIAQDPSELQNLADREPFKASQLARRLEEWTDELPPRPRHPKAGRAVYPWPVSTEGASEEGRAP